MNDQFNQNNDNNDGFRYIYDYDDVTPDTDYRRELQESLEPGKKSYTGLIVVAVSIVMAAALGVASYFVVKNVGRGGRLTEVTTEKDTEEAKEDVTEATTEERNTTISYYPISPPDVDVSITLGNEDLGTIKILDLWICVSERSQVLQKDFEDAEIYMYISDTSAKTTLGFLDSGEFEYITFKEFAETMTDKIAQTKEVHYGGDIGFENASFGTNTRKIEGVDVTVDVYCFKGNDGHYRTLYFTYLKDDKVTPTLYQKYELECGIMPLTEEEIAELRGE